MKNEKICEKLTQFYDDAAVIAETPYIYLINLNCIGSWLFSILFLVDKYACWSLFFSFSFSSQIFPPFFWVSVSPTAGRSSISKMRRTKEGAIGT